MRVLHLSTFDGVGGAARSAMRLHDGLRNIGVDSRMMVRTKTSALPEVETCSSSEHFGASFWRMVQNRYIDARRTDRSNSLFTAGYPAREIAEEPAVRAADALNLHWTWHFQSPTSLGRLFSLGKPIVWTFHDQRAFTGGCHFTAGCDGFTGSCDHCPQLSHDPAGLPARNLRDQADLWRRELVTVVAPSRWMAEEAKRSALFAGSRVEVIPYGIEIDQFRPVPKFEARRQLGIPPDCFCFLFGAESGAERRKGSTELGEALSRLLEQLPHASKILLLTFGAPSPQLERLGERCRPLGYLRGAEALRSAYSAADVFTLPSLQDTFPNTMLEALACGTPVLAFQEVGGVAEAVLEPGAGWAVPRGDVAALASMMAHLAANRPECEAAGTRARQHMERNFTLQAQAERYFKLYEELVRAGASGTRRRTQANVGPYMRAALPQLILETLRPRRASQQRQF